MVAAPEQGDLVKLNFNPTQGHEQRGYRPALVVSTTLFNEKTGFCWVVPVTSHQKGLPSECELPQRPAGIGPQSLGPFFHAGGKPVPDGQIGKASRLTVKLFMFFMRTV